jgi:hypothetical protein
MRLFAPRLLRRLLPVGKQSPGSKRKQRRETQPHDVPFHNILLQKNVQTKFTITIVLIINSFVKKAIKNKKLKMRN